MHPTVHDPQQYLTEARLGYLREQPEAARRDMPWVEGALKQHEAGRLKNFRELERGADRAGLVFLVVFLGIPIATELTTVLAPVVANHWEICVVGILVLLVVLALCPLAAMSWKRPDIGSRVTREGHARFWERPEVKLLRAPRQRQDFRKRFECAGFPLRWGIRPAFPC